MIRATVSSVASVANSRPSSVASRYTYGDHHANNNNFQGDYAAMVDIAPPMDPSMTSMSVVVDGSTLAFACYDEDRNEILLETCRVTGQETDEVVERFLQFARPNMVLVGSKIINNPKLLQLVTKAPTTTLEVDGDDDDHADANAGDQGGAVTHEVGGQTNTVTQETSQLNGGSMNGSTPKQQTPAVSRSSIPYRILKSGSFDVQKCKILILQKLRVSTLLQPHAEQEGRHIPGANDPQRQHRQFPLHSGHRYFRPSTYHSLASMIDFECKAQVQALGSLLSFLQTTIFQLDEHQMVMVNRILYANLPLFMHIDAETLSALHIFATEHHPLIAKGRGQSKEGWSLFSLLDRTRSRGGRALLREWMLKPLVDPQAIAARQDAIEAFLDSRLETGFGILVDVLAKVGPTDKILTRMQKCSAKPTDFLVLARTISAAASISSALQNEILPHLNGAGGRHHENDQSYAFLADILRRCNASVLVDLMERILATIDEEATNEFKSIMIRQGLYQGLDDWKDQYASLEDTLSEYGADLGGRYPELGGLNVVYIPQVGYLVALRKDLVLSNNFQIPQDFVHVFNQDEESYFKNTEMRDLDENIGDLDGLIKDAEAIIVNELEECILDLEHELRESSRALSELDCILSFADCAVDLNFVRPTVTSQEMNLISIKEGRHPLQEIITEKEFVCNDTCLDEINRLAVVTGPNYSGKSCYLRQVGLLVYMAHLGSFIPCTEARISVTDKLFARICTVETCAVPQSSFQLDLTQMASILLKCTSRSLVLIDEFGKGTSPSSGIALLGAALKKLSRIQCKGVCTTHFLELFSAAVIKDGVDGIKAQRMALHLPDSEDENASSLFKLEDGVASSSAGIICAKRAGVHQKVISRAKENIRNIREGKEITPITSGSNTPMAELSRAEQEMLEYFFSVDSWAMASEDQIRTLILKVARV